MLIDNFALESGKLTEHDSALLHTTVYNYYKQHGRNFSWRNTADPYHIVVSEIMLQQTQTSRVAGKFEQFVQALPSFEALAQASFHQVLALWSGLGYNRRAQALHSIAQEVVKDFSGNLPADPGILQKFSGIGPNTAGSICAFAFNMPVLFVETNIRTVFIYHCFDKDARVHDRDLLPLVAQTIDQAHPRNWYYALMDYGAMLKKTIGNANKQSASYTRQSTFEGSERQIRGMIIKLLTQFISLSYDELLNLIPRLPERIDRNLQVLCREGMVKEINNRYYL